MSHLQHSRTTRDLFEGIMPLLVGVWTVVVAAVYVRDVPDGEWLGMLLVEPLTLAKTIGPVAVPRALLWWLEVRGRRRAAVALLLGSLLRPPSRWPRPRT